MTRKKLKKLRESFRKKAKELAKYEENKTEEQGLVYKPKSETSNFVEQIAGTDSNSENKDRSQHHQPLQKQEQFEEKNKTPFDQRGRQSFSIDNEKKKSKKREKSHSKEAEESETIKKEKTIMKNVEDGVTLDIKHNKIEGHKQTGETKENNMDEKAGRFKEVQDDQTLKQSTENFLRSKEQSQINSNAENYLNRKKSKEADTNTEERVGETNLSVITNSVAKERDIFNSTDINTELPHQLPQIVQQKNAETNQARLNIEDNHPLERNTVNLETNINQDSRDNIDKPQEKVKRLIKKPKELESNTQNEPLAADNQNKVINLDSESIIRSVDKLVEIDKSYSLDKTVAINNPEFTLPGQKNDNISQVAKDGKQNLREPPNELSACLEDSSVVASIDETKRDTLETESSSNELNKPFSISKQTGIVTAKVNHRLDKVIINEALDKNLQIKKVASMLVSDVICNTLSAQGYKHLINRTQMSDTQKINAVDIFLNNESFSNSVNREKDQDNDDITDTLDKKPNLHSDTRPCFPEKQFINTTSEKDNTNVTSLAATNKETTSLTNAPPSMGANTSEKQAVQTELNQSNIGQSSPEKLEGKNKSMPEEDQLPCISNDVLELYTHKNLSEKQKGEAYQIKLDGLKEISIKQLQSLHSPKKQMNQVCREKTIYSQSVESNALRKVDLATDLSVKAENCVDLKDYYSAQRENSEEELFSATEERTHRNHKTVPSEVEMVPSLDLVTDDQENLIYGNEKHNSAENVNFDTPTPNGSVIQTNTFTNTAEVIECSGSQIGCLDESKVREKSAKEINLLKEENKRLTSNIETLKEEIQVMQVPAKTKDLYKQLFSKKRKLKASESLIRELTREKEHLKEQLNLSRESSVDEENKEMVELISGIENTTSLKEEEFQVGENVSEHYSDLKVKGESYREGEEKRKKNELVISEKELRIRKLSDTLEKQKKEYENIKSNLIEKESQLTTEKQNFTKLDGENNYLKQKIEEIDALLISKEKEKESKNQELILLNEQLESYKNQVNDLKTVLKSCPPVSAFNQIRNEKDAIREERDKAKKQLDSALKAIKEGKAYFKNLSAGMKTVQNDNEILHKKLQQQEERTTLLLTQVNELDREKNELKTILEKRSTSLENEKKSQLENRNKQEELNETLKTYQITIVTLESLAKEQHEQKSKLQSEYQKVLQESKIRQSKLAEMKIKSQELQSTYEQLVKQYSKINTREINKSDEITQLKMKLEENKVVLELNKSLQEENKALKLSNKKLATDVSNVNTEILRAKNETESLIAENRKIKESMQRKNSDENSKFKAEFKEKAKQMQEMKLLEEENEDLKLSNTKLAENLEYAESEILNKNKKIELLVAENKKFKDGSKVHISIGSNFHSDKLRVENETLKAELQNKKQELEKFTPSSLQVDVLRTHIHELQEALESTEEELKIEKFRNMKKLPKEIIAEKMAALKKLRAENENLRQELQSVNGLMEAVIRDNNRLKALQLQDELAGKPVVSIFHPFMTMYFLF